MLNLLERWWYGLGLMPGWMFVLWLALVCLVLIGLGFAVTRSGYDCAECQRENAKPNRWKGDGPGE